jgi:hypothetical protein
MAMQPGWTSPPSTILGGWPLTFAARPGKPYVASLPLCRGGHCREREPVNVSWDRALQIVQSWEEQRLKLTALNERAERVLGWDLAFRATHVLQRAREAARQHQRNATAATLVHVVISVLENKLPDFARVILKRKDPRVRLIVYNKLASTNVSTTTIDAHGNEQHNVPLTTHLRNCAAYVEYVDRYYEQLPDVAVLLKTHLVSVRTADFMIETATRNLHDVDAHPWPEWQARTLTYVRCHSRWAWSPLYQQLCPCADAALQWLSARGCTWRCSSKLLEQTVRCEDAPNGQLGEYAHRADRPRPLVEEIFGEGLFAFSRAALRQHPRRLYQGWKREHAENGENHAPCIEEWVTLFDEPGDAPWGRTQRPAYPFGRRARVGCGTWRRAPSPERIRVA